MSPSLHPGANPDCPRCRGDGYGVARAGAYAVAHPCSCLVACPDCRGTGFVATSDQPRAPRRRCRCQGLTSRIAAFNEAHIPARHATSTRSGFKATGPRTSGFVKVADWLTRFDPTGENRGLVLWGEVGRGKTHLAVAVLRELAFTRGVRVKFVEFSHLLADLRAGFDVGRGMAPLMDPLVKVDVLAIDELGKGLRTDFELNVVDELISRRYNAMKPILATTNYAPRPATGRVTANPAEVALGQVALPSLEDRVGERVFSRLRETADFVELRGDDWRVQNRGRRDT